MTTTISPIVASGLVSALYLSTGVGAMRAAHTDSDPRQEPARQELGKQLVIGAAAGGLSTGIAALGGWSKLPIIGIAFKPTFARIATPALAVGLPALAGAALALNPDRQQKGDIQRAALTTMLVGATLGSSAFGIGRAADAARPVTNRVALLAGTAFAVGAASFVTSSATGR